MTIIGILMGLMCFGVDILHLFGQSVISYILILTVTRKNVHLVVLVFSMGYLSVLRIYRQLNESESEYQIIMTKYMMKIFK